MGAADTYCTQFAAEGTQWVSVDLTRTGCGLVDCGSDIQQVTISPPPPPTVQIDSIDPIALGPGGSLSISATGRDGFGNPTSGTYAWSTSNGSVLTVSGSGGSVQITGIGPGTSILSVEFATQQGNAADQVTVNVVSANATAFRLQTNGPGYGVPFSRTPVPESEELTPGAGIRVNGDTESAAEENDLIEMELVVAPFPPPPGVEFVLRRSGSNLRVWNDSGMDTPLLVSASEAQITLAGGIMSVWVEDTSSVAGEIEFVPRDILRNADLTSDTVHFYPFSGIVIALGGLGQVPTDPADNNHGTFQLAIELYGQGYDVHMFDEDSVSTDGSGLAYDEVVSAVQNRGINQVAIYGYSYGGGSTYDLAERLDNNQAAIGLHNLVFTAYIDSVENDSLGLQETRRPLGSQFHVNYYQGGSLFEDGGLDGGPTDPPGADFELNVDDPTPTHTHYTIDDDSVVLNGIATRLASRTGK
jgi:hypothetical protein